MSIYDYPSREIRGDEITDKYAESLIEFLEQGNQLSPVLKVRLLNALSGPGHLQKDQASNPVMEKVVTASLQRTITTEVSTPKIETGSNVEQIILNNLDKA